MKKSPKSPKKSMKTAKKTNKTIKISKERQLEINVLSAALEFNRASKRCTQDVERFLNAEVDLLVATRQLRRYIMSA